MRMMEELIFSLGLQIKQSDDKIIVHQTKYVKEFLKKFLLNDDKSMSTPMHPTTSLGLEKEYKQ